MIFEAKLTLKLLKFPKMEDFLSLCGMVAVPKCTEALREHGAGHHEGLKCLG